MAKIASGGSDEFRLLGLLDLPGADHLRVARFVHKASLEQVYARESCATTGVGQVDQAAASTLAAGTDSE